MISLTLAAAAATVSFAAWRWWQPPPAVPVIKRNVSGVDLTYRCEAGHVFIAPGQTGDRLCSTCSEPAFPITKYECRIHGPFEVAVRFQANPDGGSHPVQWRIAGGPWISSEDELVCPRCGAKLVRRAIDPADAAIRSGRKPGSDRG